MTPERFRQVRDTADAALDRPDLERASFVAEACGGDDTLRAEVESLLAAYDAVRSQSFLRTSAAELAHAALTDVPDEPGGGPLPAGSRIGAYDVEGTIGHGGMGTVYRAVRNDDAFRKTVALKLARGGIRSDYLQQRFRQERKILARLQHPNIATVLDGGSTPDGQPYLVMERVEGLPITQYCVEKDLGLNDRLALFRTVCAAVQYAHQNLVIHRDLKPDNILVTPDGTPKLLDFGIAKVLAAGLDPEEAPTATIMPMLTPDYASPEQVRGDPVTTASDVYSLGVLLYELLVGRRPYEVRSDSLQEIVRMVCETEPALPSTAAARTRGALAEGSGAVPAATLRGDLDTIVMKALRKEPSRRYGSAHDLSADIERHLRGLPVLARPDTLRYRAGKFVGRHKAAMAAAALVLASLVGAIVITTRQARIAEQRLQDTRRLANVLLFEASDAMRDVPGTTEARTLIIKRALEYHDRLAAAPDRDPLMRLEHSTAYIAIGDNFEELGDSGLALESYGKALAMRRQLAAEAPSDMRALQQVGTAHNRMGSVLRAQGDLDGAVGHHREGLRIAEQAAVLGDAPSRRRIVVAQFELCNDFLAVGRAAEALSAARAGLVLARRLVEESRSPDTLKVEAALLEREADALALAGDHEAALASLLAMQDQRSAALAEQPENSRSQLDSISLSFRIGTQLAALGRAEEAKAHLADALLQAEALKARSPRDVETQDAVAESRLAYANVVAPTARAEAMAQYEKAGREIRELKAGDPSNLTHPSRLAALLLQKARLHADSGHMREAGASLEESAALTADLMKKAPTVHEHQLLFARTRSRQAMGVTEGGPAACQLLQAAAAVWADLESRGYLAPADAAESLSTRTAAGNCPGVAKR